MSNHDNKTSKVSNSNSNFDQITIPEKLIKKTKVLHIPPILSQITSHQTFQNQFTSKCTTKQVQNWELKKKWIISHLRAKSQDKTKYALNTPLGHQLGLTKRKSLWKPRKQFASKNAKLNRLKTENLIKIRLTSHQFRNQIPKPVKLNPNHLTNQNSLMDSSNKQGSFSTHFTINSQTNKKLKQSSKSTIKEDTNHTLKISTPTS